MFTEKQLELLLTVQYQDDWSAYYFPTALEDWDAMEMDSRERETLIEYVKSLSLEQIWHLQMALNHLNLLPQSCFSPKTEQMDGGKVCAL